MDDELENNLVDDEVTLENDELDTESDNETTEDEGTEDSTETEEESTEEQDEDDELVVTLGGESPPPKEKEPAPEWVKELRKAHRETAAELKKAKAKLEQYEKPQTQVPTLGKKPTLDDYDYDAEKFEQELTKWHDKKRSVEKAQQEAEAAKQAETEAWNAKLAAYGEARTKLKVKDYDDAEANVQEALDVTQQGILIEGSDDAALLVYALGKNDQRLKELSAIKNPVKFAFAVAKLEKDLKVSNRKAPPPPEKRVTSTTGATKGSADSTLERLRTQAEKTGDYSKVVAYKTKLKQAGKK